MQLCMGIMVMLCTYFHSPAQQIPPAASPVSWHVPQDGRYSPGPETGTTDWT
jgi:hypothetical protein